MAPKRKATEALDEVVKSSYHVNFPLYPEADLIVESSSGTLFATRALYLRAVSSVFDDILSLPPPDDQSKVDGLPTIKIEENEVIFEVFLRYAHRGRLLVNGEPPSPSWPTILLLSKLFDKYDSPDLARSLLLEQLPNFLGDPKDARPPRYNKALPISVFAVAVVHGIQELAKTSLRWSQRSGVTEEGARVFFQSPKDNLTEIKQKDWRPSHLGDLPLDLLARLPLPVVQKFSNLYSKVLVTPGYSWINAGDDFEL